MNYFNIYKFAQSSIESLSLEDQIYKMYVEKPMSARAIGRRLGMDWNVVIKILRKMGVDVAPKEWSAGRYPKINSEEKGDKVLKDFWYLYNRAIKNAVPPTLKILLTPLCKRYNIKAIATMVTFLDAHIPNFQELAQSLSKKRYSTKMNNQTINSIIKAYQNGYSAQDIARHLGIYETQVLYLLKQLGMSRTRSQSSDARRNQRARKSKLKPLEKILDPASMRDEEDLSEWRKIASWYKQLKLAEARGKIWIDNFKNE